MIEPLTLEWIVSTLKKSGVNSKKQVIDRLEQATPFELLELFQDIKKSLINDMMKETPMKPTIIDEPSLHYIYYCPDCGATLMVDRNKHPKHLFNYCGSCSKKLDWSEEDD